jgi:hypothetical protein
LHIFLRWDTILYRVPFAYWPLRLNWRVCNFRPESDRRLCRNEPLWTVHWLGLCFFGVYFTIWVLLCTHRLYANSVRCCPRVGHHLSVTAEHAWAWRQSSRDVSCPLSITSYHDSSQYTAWTSPRYSVSKWLPRRLPCQRIKPT